MSIELPNMYMARRLGWIRPAAPHPPAPRPASRRTKYPALRGLDSKSSEYQAAYRAMVKARKASSQPSGDAPATPPRPAKL